jgi:O-antigen/teichoic acid export membrane protein
MARVREEAAVSTRAAPESAPEPPRHSMARNAANLLWGQVGTTALGIFLTAMLGRWLTPAEYGLYFVYLSMWTFAFVVVEWGQSQYLMREVARRPDRASALLGGALAIRLAGAVAAAAVTAGAAALLGYDRRSCLLAPLALVTMIPFFLAQAYGVTFRGRERMECDAAIQVVNKGLTLGFTVLALLVGLGLLGALLAQVAAGAGALILAVVLARRVGIPARTPDRGVARELLLGGTPIVMMYLAHSAQAYIDAVVLSKLVPNDVVGWFGAAKNVLGTLIAPALILGSAAFPRLSRAAQDRAQFRRELGGAMRPVLLLAAYAAVGTYVFADLAIAVIYGAGRFDPAVPILQVSAPSFFLFFVDVLLGSAIVASDRAVSMAVAKVFNVLASTVLDFLLIPYFQHRYGNGGLGAAIAYGGSEVIMFVAALWIIPRGSLGLAFAGDFLRAVAVAGGALAVVALLPPLWPVWGLLIATAVFAVLAVVLRLVTRADLQLMLDLVKRKAVRA